MATKLYPLGRKAFLDGDIDWVSNNIKVSLIDTADYTYDDAHQYYSEIPAGAIVATSGNLESKTSTDGVADAADVTLSAVTGDVSEALIIWQDTGNPATSRLIAYIDSGTGLPVTPDGTSINIHWSDAATKIFRL